MKIRPQKRVVFAGKTPIFDYESYSSLTLFAKCQVLFYERYFSHVKETGTPEMLLGTAVHATIEDALWEKKMGTAFAVEWLVERFHILWSLELYLAKSKPEGIAFKQKSPAKYEAAGAELMKKWYAERLPTTKPELIEHPFSLVISGARRSVYGRIDLVAKGPVIVDYKSTSRPFELMKSDVRKQFGVYFAAYVQEFDVWPKGEVHILSTTGKGTSVEPMNLEAEDVQDVLDNFVRPKMIAIDKAWAAQKFPCTCGKHKDAIVLPGDFIGGPITEKEKAMTAPEKQTESERATKELLDTRQAERKSAWDGIDLGEIPF